MSNLIYNPNWTWIEINKSFKEVKDEILKAGIEFECIEDTFKYDDNQSKWKKLTREGTTNIRYLVGSVNVLGGLCDDCPIHNDVIVVRYRALLINE